MQRRRWSRRTEVLKKHFEWSNTLKSLLGLKYSPVAVKFVKKDEQFKSNLIIDLNGKYRYCQMMMEAKNGKICVLSSENITCPAAAALGFKMLLEKIAQGTMLKTLGLFEKKEYGKMLMEKIPRLKANELKNFLALPLEKCNFTPELLIIEDTPEKIM